MKIDGLGTRPNIAAMDHDSGRRTTAMESDFASELDDQQGDLTQEQLQQLLEEIDEQGARLTKTPTYDELKSYRNLVKNFVGTVVSQMYTVNTQSGWDRELENMAEKIRLGQSSQLDIVASHDAIRGMLVDLYM